MKNKKANTSFLLTTGSWLLTTFLRISNLPQPLFLWWGGPLCPPKVIVSVPSAKFCLPAAHCLLPDEPSCSMLSTQRTTDNGLLTIEKFPGFSQEKVVSILWVVEVFTSRKLYPTMVPQVVQTPLLK